MKKIITSLLLITSLPILAVSADMIINRTGQPITVTYANASGPLFSTGAITLASDAAHRADQMILIPTTSVVNPSATTAGAMYQNSATSATIMVGTVAVSIPAFAASTSYVIAPTTPGATTFIANPGIITYDIATGAGTPGSPSPVAPGAGF
jgi:hypothetical protein